MIFKIGDIVQFNDVNNGGVETPGKIVMIQDSFLFVEHPKTRSNVLVRKTNCIKVKGNYYEIYHLEPI